MVGQRPKLKIHKLDPTQNFQKIDPPAPYWQCNVNFVQYRGNIGTFFPNYKLSPAAQQVKEAKVSTAKIMALFTFCVKAVFFLKEEISLGLQLKRRPS